MGDSKVYYLPLDKFKDVPSLISRAAGTFFGEGGFVALKVHFGEKGNRGFIHPEWVRPVVEMVKERKAYPFLTDTNTIYRGQRSDAVHHLMIAHGHGFKLEKVGAPVIIADGLRGNDYVEVPTDGKYYKKTKIGRAIHEAHAMIVLSHVKGHILTGFGGAIKNLGMGCAAKGAKYEMHAGAYPTLVVENCTGCGECIVWCSGDALSLVDGKILLDKAKCVGCGECILACSNKAIEIPWNVPSEKVAERLVEHAAGAIKGKKTCYVNFMHHISMHCDCWSGDNPVITDDVGILVSTDPVAIDQASIDMINKKAGRDIFADVHPGVDYTVQLKYAEDMGLGIRKYEVV